MTSSPFMKIGDLGAKIEAARAARERAQAAKPVDAGSLAVDAVQPVSNVVKLPVWAEAVRAMPNGILRSSLFSAIKRGRRRFMNNEQVASLDGIQINYKGERLDQNDLDVYENVLHVLRTHEMGKQCRITSYALLKLLDLTDTGKNRKTLYDRIIRLRANAVVIKQGRHTYIGGLVDEGYQDEVTQEWVIVLNPKLRALYEADQFTNIEWTVRRALKGQQLAQWLHGFYATHEKPFPIKVETIHRLCGSDSNSDRMDNFKTNLKLALDAVSKASTENGEHFSYSFVGDLVHIDKTPKPRRPRA